MPVLDPSRPSAMDPPTTKILEHGCLELVSSKGSRVPPHDQQKGAQHLGNPHSALQRSFLETKAKNDDEPRYRALSLSQSSLRSASSRCFSPSPTSTPTNYSFGPLSPNSLQSGLHTPPSIAGMSFCHSRESSLDEGLPVGAIKNQDLFSSLRAAVQGKGHQRGAASADSSVRHRHRPVQSIEWIKWRQAAEEESNSPGFEQRREDEDDDLVAYRGEPGVEVRLMSAGDESSDSEIVAIKTPPPTPDSNLVDNTGPGSSYASPHTPSRQTPPSISTEEGHDARTPQTPCSEPQSSSTTDCDDDDTDRKAEHVARTVLVEGFNLRLGYTEPPADIVDAVRDCLEGISLSLQRARGMGFLTTAASSDSPASSAATPSSGTLSRNQSKASRKRASRKLSNRDDDDLHEEESDGEGGAEAGGQTEPGNRKKPKLDQYPCPFRKRNPLRFNCREWEYCAKAPFKSMTDLKKHIIKYHYQQELAFKCIRCRERFARMEDLESHMLVDAIDICERRTGERDQRDEETINDAVAERLRSRTEQFGWEKLWETLFPRDVKVPAAGFDPIVENYEVDQSYHNGWPIFQEKLALTLETLLSTRSGLSERDMLQCRLLMGSTVENIVKEFVASFFQESRNTASKPFEPTPHTVAVNAEVRATRPAARAPSLVSTRPTSLASSSSRSGPRSIRPNIGPRGSDWSSHHSNAPSPSTSARQSATSFGANHRASFAESVSGFQPQVSTTAYAPPRPTMVTLPSRPVQGATAVAFPKRRTPLHEGGAGNPRDSAITDMGCPNCLLGNPCQCASPYFDMEAYIDEAAVAPSAFCSASGGNVSDIQFFAGGELNHVNGDGVNSGIWDMQSFSG
ncbi:hypothetical protein QBC34DRAFT_402671 [Podospora aff. communis PSN243]|uniref:C2H2-type domain-containing protein n=1 Tax=Podospora aff. communis PSN243 TaxID=3040156 RepID=A0AAV9GQQ6_9PEZI|nr:hypothetical protein QBC34DRAFT_402671 [Podospora aff. communis PSN243]